VEVVPRAPDPGGEHGENGLALTIDLIHLNDRAGTVVANLVEGFALKEEE
jgi:hypothetical protein